MNARSIIGGASYIVGIGLISIAFLLALDGPNGTDNTIFLITIFCGAVLFLLGLVLTGDNEINQPLASG